MKRLQYFLRFRERETKDRIGLINLILIIILFCGLHRANAQTSINNMANSNADGKTVIRIPATPYPGFHSMPLEYSTLTTRIEAKLKMNLDRDTTSPFNCFGYWK